MPRKQVDPLPGGGPVLTPVARPVDPYYQPTRDPVAPAPAGTPMALQLAQSLRDLHPSVERYFQGQHVQMVREMEQYATLQLEQNASMKEWKEAVKRGEIHEADNPWLQKFVKQGFATRAAQQFAVRAQELTDDQSLLASGDPAQMTAALNRLAADTFKEFGGDMKADPDFFQAFAQAKANATGAAMNQFAQNRRRWLLEKRDENLASIFQGNLEQNFQEFITSSGGVDITEGTTVDELPDNLKTIVQGWQAQLDAQYATGVSPRANEIIVDTVKKYAMELGQRDPEAGRDLVSVLHVLKGGSGELANTAYGREAIRNVHDMMDRYEDRQPNELAQRQRAAKIASLDAAGELQQYVAQLRRDGAPLLDEAFTDKKLELVAKYGERNPFIEAELESMIKGYTDLNDAEESAERDEFLYDLGKSMVESDTPERQAEVLKMLEQGRAEKWLTPDQYLGFHEALANKAKVEPTLSAPARAMADRLRQSVGQTIQIAHWQSVMNADGTMSDGPDETGRLLSIQAEYEFMSAFHEMAASDEFKALSPAEKSARASELADSIINPMLKGDEEAIKEAQEIRSQMNRENKTLQEVLAERAKKDAPAASDSESTKRASRIRAEAHRQSSTWFQPTAGEVYADSLAKLAEVQDRYDVGEATEEEFTAAKAEAGRRYLQTKNRLDHVISKLEAGTVTLPHTWGSPAAVPSAAVPLISDEEARQEITTAFRLVGPQVDILANIPGERFKAVVDWRKAPLFRSIEHLESSFGVSSDGMEAEPNAYGQFLVRRFGMEGRDALALKFYMAQKELLTPPASGESSGSPNSNQPSTE